MRKLGLLLVVMVLSLGVLGVGYSLWYENLYIDGYIETGNVDVEWSVEDFGREGDIKDVSKMDAYIIENILFVDVYNAYPCVTYWVDFDIHSIGTIPVHVGEIVIDWDGIPEVAVEYGLDWYGPCQLHYDEHGYGRLYFHFDNTAEELAEYGFKGVVTCGQYNEFECGQAPVMDN